ncbi:MAG: TonB-dependent receptor [Gemmatimonadota bacterium]|nr:TonB-dependent receptor [Gemmatimonadota bacterium]
MSKLGPIVFALLVRGAPPVALAQTPDSLNRSRVVPRADSSVIHLQPVEIRATIVPRARADVGSTIPASITDITHREIVSAAPRFVTDALRATPGISTYDDLGSPAKITVGMRGFTVGPTVGVPPGVSVFLDGVRQNEPDAQEVNFDLLPMDLVDHIEVLRGTGSLLGPNSLGGAINLVTRAGAQGPPNGTIELSAGSFGARAASASINGALARDRFYNVGGGLDREAGWRDATASDGYHAFSRIGTTGARRGLSILAFASHSNAATAGSLPESIFSSPRTNFTAGDADEISLAQASLQGYAPFAAGTGSFTAYLRHSAADRFNVNQAPDDNVRSITANATLGGTVDWRWTTVREGSALSIRTGFDGTVNRVRVRLYTEPPAGARNDDSLTTDVHSPGGDLAAFAIADLRLRPVTLSVGARYDYISVPFQNALDPTVDTTSTFKRLSPRGGASIALPHGAALYASVGQSFRAPAILELACADPEASCPLPFALGADPPLAPVRATTYELGGRWLIARGLISAAAYRTAVSDEILFVASEGALLSGYFTNVSRTRRVGGELSAQWSFLDGALATSASYTYTRATFESPAQIFSIRSLEEGSSNAYSGTNAVVAGDEIPLSPTHQLSLVAVAAPRDGVEVGVDAQYHGRQWFRGDEANETSPLPSYVMTRARIGFRVRAWDLSAVVNNVLGASGATFGTFNINRGTGQLERFLSPADPRALKLVVARRIGRESVAHERFR